MLNFDVVVIGGGPAGMAAAIESSKAGAKTALIERDKVLGGILTQCIHNGFGLHYFKEELTGPEYAQKFIALLKEQNIEIMLNTFVCKVNQNKVEIINTNGAEVINAKSIVLATGCRERTAGAIKLCGTRPVGVYTAGQVQKMVNMYGKMPGKEFVVLGSGDIGLIMARRLTCEGGNVKLICEIGSEVGGLKRNLVQCVEDYNIPLSLSSTITKIVGKNRVEGIYYANVDKNFNIIPETEKFVKCDCVLLSVGLIPETDLFSEFVINNATGGAYVNEYRETNIKGVFSCGNVLHVHDLVDNVSDESKIAGFYAAQNAINKLSYDNGFKIGCGNNIRYTVPSIAYKNSQTLSIYFRVNNKVTNKFLVVRDNKSIIAKKFVMAIAPNEMQKLEIDKTNINGDITISMEDKI